ncbi:DUF1283 domain-containing protein [Serratia marcescens]|uniref:DUF1283 domain-containing protein n=1 Tax=Serratia marcescens TaxID=615 RepID=UPI0007CCDF41|nr:DUF1283 domain-containing protein [Serratia marcescens]OAH28955.1 hypothetical protein AYJ10_04870 [Serratia marcescens]
MKLQIGIKLSLLLAILLTPSVMAHPGRTNADGCHTNRKTGEYHCHGSKRQRTDYFREQAPRDNKITSSPAKSPQSSSKKIGNGAKKNQTGLTIRGKKPGEAMSPPVAQPLDRQALCVNSENIHAYWESVTGRCLDRTTGREIKPL